MEGHSWNNWKIQGALIAQDIDKSPGRVGHSTSPRCKTGDVAPPVISKNIYIIGKAYDEPVFCDHIETLLLQRNFIID